MLAVLEIPIHLPHDPVQPVAGAVAAGVVIRLAVLLGPLAQLDYLLQYRPAQVPLGPLLQPSQSLRHAPAVVRPEGVPDLLADGPEHLLEVLAPVADGKP